MSDIEVEDEQSPNPRFWLEFRTFDDGLSSHSRSPSTFTAFPQFAQFPPELRLRIWSFLVQPRIVVVCCLQRDERLDERRYELNQRSRGRSVPVLLHINREARYMALEHYELAFGWRISKLLSDTPVSAPPRVWFNFNLDCVYLAGELEAYDIYGFNSAMVYFLRREDTHRVKHLACVLSELGYAEQESDQVFGCLWHVVDGFPAAKKVLLTVGEGDGEALKGSKLRSTDNVMQKIWNGFLGGSATETSSRMADKSMIMIEEDDLPEIVAGH